MSQSGFYIALRQDRAKILKVKFFLLAILISITHAGAETPAFKPIFNGKDLKGWEGIGGSTENWKAQDGIMPALNYQTIMVLLGQTFLAPEPVVPLSSAAHALDQSLTMDIPT